jgi:MoaA/NifB/PqqE/SkfB family radical SAM enzyme
MSEIDPINIRYVTDYPKCNYFCTYCIAGHGEAFPEKPRRWNPQRYLRITKNLAKLPFKINVRLGVAGEFFLDKTLCKGACSLSHSTNTVSVNLITNLSFSYKQYKKILDEFCEGKVAIVASFHPTEIKDHELWLDTASAMAEVYDFAVILVAYPPLIDKIAEYKGKLNARKIETFIQPFMGPYGKKHYPNDYTTDERDLLRDQMYSRHDYEFLLNLKKPGLCNAGYKSLFINPDGVVYPCGMGSYSVPLGNLSCDHQLELRSKAMPCPFNTCPCDTENVNTVQHQLYYESDSINQHKYHYRFRKESVYDERYDEWNIQY